MEITMIIIIINTMEAHTNTAKHIKKLEGPKIRNLSTTKVVLRKPLATVNISINNKKPSQFLKRT